MLGYRWAAWLGFALVVAGACSHRVSPRYAFDAALTYRATCCERESAPTSAYAILLLARGVELCALRGRSMGDFRSFELCQSWIKGPAQVRVPRGKQSLDLHSVDERGVAVAEHRLTHVFDAGHIYEVFVEEQEETVDFQLHSVSPERYERLHRNAPAALRRAPRPAPAPPAAALPTGFQSDGSMAWPGDDVLPPVQTALLWPCPGDTSAATKALSYSALVAACKPGFLELDDESTDITAAFHAMSALNACLTEQFMTPDTWALVDIGDEDLCEAALGASWHIPNFDELTRLRWEATQQERASTRVAFLPPRLLYVLARDDSNTIVSSPLLAEYQPARGEVQSSATLLCMRDGASPPPRPLEERACLLAPTATAPTGSVNPVTRINDAVEERYSWAAERLEAELPRWPLERLGREYPRFVDDVLDLPERLKRMTQRYARTDPAISLRQHHESVPVARVVTALRELGQRMRAVEQTDSARVGECRRRLNDKHGCADLPDTRRLSETLHRLRRLGILH